MFSPDELEERAIRRKQDSCLHVEVTKTYRGGSHSGYTCTECKKFLDKSEYTVKEELTPKQLTVWILVGGVTVSAIAYFTTNAYKNYLEGEAVKRYEESLSPEQKRERDRESTCESLEAFTQAYKINDEQMKAVAELRKKNNCP